MILVRECIRLCHSFFLKAYFPLRFVESREQHTAEDMMPSSIDKRGGRFTPSLDLTRLTAEIETQLSTNVCWVIVMMNPICSVTMMPMATVLNQFVPIHIKHWKKKGSAVLHDSLRTKLAISIREMCMLKAV